jgi:XTP/dITP diphosphohydrolase
MEFYERNVLKMDIIFATKNEKKIKEARKILGENFSVMGIEIEEEIPETGNTFEENALQKLKFSLDYYNGLIFSEDSGLIVDSLNGEPGIYSARYAPDGKHIHKLLKKLEGETNRKARFYATIALHIKNDFYIFTGECEGVIAEKGEGNGGFGYDPIFIPDGYEQSFAVLGEEIKNRISHRRKALEKLRNFLETNEYGR